MTKVGLGDFGPPVAANWRVFRQLVNLPPAGQSPASWSIFRQLVNLPPTGQFFLPPTGEPPPGPPLAVPRANITPGPGAVGLRGGRAAGGWAHRWETGVDIYTHVHMFAYIYISGVHLHGRSPSHQLVNPRPIPPPTGESSANWPICRQLVNLRPISPPPTGEGWSRDAQPLPRRRGPC